MQTSALAASSETQLDFLAGGGELAAHMRALDWTRTPLGHPITWPQSLKTSVSLILNSKHPMWIGWGPQATFLYNDAYIEVLGRAKHPWALGRPASEVWAEIWDVCGPLAEKVFKRGEATFVDDVQLFMMRGDFLEETYYSFSYSPIRDETGGVAGLFCPSTETTAQLLNNRRLRTLSALAANALAEKSVAAACSAAARIVSQNPSDIPFCLIYLLETDAQNATLAASVGLASDELAPTTVSLSRANADRWHVADVVDRRAARTISLENLPGIPAGPAGRRVVEAIGLPLQSPGSEAAIGVLIAGINPTRRLDDEYQTFFELVAGHTSAAIQNARYVEEQQKRAEMLAQLDRAKTAFFSNVSHEFRTPLTLMMGPLHDVLSDGSLEARHREHLTMMHRNALRLSKLVNSLLEFSRIEAGRHLATYRQTDLAALTTELASTFRSAMEKGGLEYRVQCEPLPETAFVDRDMWEKIVLNLLSNALKYTMQGTVSISLRPERDEAVLVVEDTGTGIPADDVPKLFERFHRVEGAQGRTHEGSGIGLALVNELVKLHGGTVTAQSTLGVGSEFTVRIPLGKSHLPTERVIQAREPTSVSRQSELFVQEALRWMPDERIEVTDALVTAETDPPLVGGRYRTTHGARIVLADDNGDMRAYLRRLLQPRFEVEAVANGEEALAAIRRQRPALVLSDVMMPMLDGFGLLAAIRKDDDLRTVPLILLSARAGEEARVEGLQAGADDYLVKPFTARELLARVEAMIEMDRLRRVNEEQLRLGLARAMMFTWQLDIPTQEMHLSANAGDVLGMAPRDLRQGYSIIHPDDAVRHRKAMEEAIRARGEVTDEIRIIRPNDGQTRWIEVRARAICNERGDATKLSGISFDITARKQMEHALIDADRRKDEFLAMLAHELRNPLAPIRNSGELLARLLTNDSRAQHAVQIVNRQVRQMTRMVDDLLDVSRITRGRIELEHKPVNLNDVIAAAIEAVEPLVRDRNHQLSIVTGIEALIVNGDAARLQQCVVNLLTNAIKYTDAGGTLRVELRRADETAEISVMDNGTGIPPDLLPHVFDLFVQSDRTLDRSQGGLGIGLSVVKQLINMHGGSVTGESPGIGAGSTFKISLPLAAPESASAEATVKSAFLSKRVLIVDDNKDAAESLAMVLQMDSHEVRTTYTAQGALNTLSEWAPDAALVDIGLPDMDGYTLARRLRAMPTLNDTQLIALTGYGQPEDQRRASEAGFDAHLVKPAPFDAITELLAKSRSGRS
ncbi:MAG TPA: ATP-binding protein [Steroidobacteraceae bacterium]|nr:ATP-binding protein [Steroidobacteraceae bacterium]